MLDGGNLTVLTRGNSTEVEEGFFPSWFPMEWFTSGAAARGLLPSSLTLVLRVCTGIVTFVN
jgi:hypothetical protein